jgi:MFS transporter, ceroid-lipofuscinosis neuronal protein 7
LDPHAGKEFLGFVTAATPLAETIFSPILGYWSNRSGSVRMPLLATLALLTLASTGYSLLEAFPAGTVKYWMIVTRFLIGISAGQWKTAYFIVLLFIIKK